MMKKNVFKLTIEYLTKKMKKYTFDNYTYLYICKKTNLNILVGFYLQLPVPVPNRQKTRRIKAIILIS